MNRAPRGIDRHLQRIMDATGGNDQSRSAPALNCSFKEALPADHSFEAAARQNEDPMLLNELDQASFGFGSSRQRSTTLSTASDRGSYNFDPSHQQSTALSSVPDRGSYSIDPSHQSSRLSLAPRNIYNQQEAEPREPTNADHRFRFAQNLRQGLPANRASLQPPPANSSSQEAPSPLTQLANNMLLQRPMQQTIHQNPNRLNELQPRRQEITPPFNLSGFIFSPNTQRPPSSSSPAVQNSSPTVRVSLRRAANRAAPSSELQEEGFGFEDTYDEPVAAPETPQRQVTASTSSITRSVPQTLALGHAPPIARGIQLVSPHRLPDRFRQVFPYELFNAAQSKCFDPIYNSDDNVVVSAPTGSGKTALLELAICKLVAGHSSGQFKIVYQAPTKSLCSERMRDWRKKFSHLNLACAELTGDTGHAEMNRVGAASIIVTTPEKWDSITRKWKDYSRLLQLVKLFLIDEVHILKDTRGATLEAVVSRMKTSGANVRFIALSATVPNSQDIAVWLGKDHTNDHLPAHRETFGEDFRPVKLQKHVYGYDGHTNDFAFEKILDGKLPTLIQRHTHKKPIMVFCFTRKSCETTAIMLAEWWTRQRVVDRAWPAPAQKINVGSKELRELVGCGVAFHHAGLDPQDRHAIETAFLKGDVSVICCTSTLAVGINLPCHLVVLKGTVCFQDGNLTEFSDLEIMQMLGRAGRPQFDDSAVAIIMTRSDKAEKYKKMITGQDILESTLHLNLIEHLNSEIGLGTVRDLYTAKKWLSGTFLSVRMRQNPNYYKLEGVVPNRDADERLGLVCERDIKLLQEHKLVEEKEGRLSGTEYGQAMSRYMVQFETMKLLLSLPEKAKTGEILHLLCQASEFRDLRMKPNERSSLREFNKSPFIKFPIKENITTTAHKISLIIQVQLGGIDLPTDKDFNVIRRQFNMEKNIIFERVQRLIRCIVDCKAYDCDAIATRHALDLARSLSAEFWENSNLQLRQIPQIGPAAVRKLVTSDVNSVEKLASLDTATIERIMGKNPPFGRKTLDNLAGLPRLTLASEIMGKPITKAGQNPKVNVRAVLGFQNAKVPMWNGSRPSLTFMAETTGGTMVNFWRGNIYKLDKGFDLKFCVELSNPDDRISCHIACDEIVGTLRSLTLDPDVPASLFPPARLKQTTLPMLITKVKDNNVEGDEFGTDGIEDDELLAALGKVEAPKSDCGSDGFTDVDNYGEVPEGVDSEKDRTEPTDSVQMENGKWTCNHHCGGGKLLRNGNTCKHVCCKEGLDKRPGPRRTRLKASMGTAEPLPSSNTQVVSKSGKKGKKEKSEFSGTSSRANKTNSRAFGTNPRAVSKAAAALSSGRSSNDDYEDIEVVDLAEVLSPIAYSKLAPHDYRKLHNLHESVQKDKEGPPVCLPKQKPQFSYASGVQPDPPFLRKSEDEDEDGYAIFADEDSDEEETLPSPSRLAACPKGENYDRFGCERISYDEAQPTSSAQDPSLESLEAVMLDLDDPMPFRPPTPKVNSSFASAVFDFDAFHEKYGEPEPEPDVYSSPLMSHTRKRERSASPTGPETKHRRIEEEELETSAPMTTTDKEENSPVSEVPVVESRRVKLHDLLEVSTQPKAEQSRQQRSVPDWVGEFDAGLIEGLIDIVDFVD